MCGHLQPASSSRTCPALGTPGSVVEASAGWPPPAPALDVADGLSLVTAGDAASPDDEHPVTVSTAAVANLSPHRPCSPTTACAHTRKLADEAPARAGYWLQRTDWHKPAPPPHRPVGADS